MELTQTERGFSLIQFTDAAGALCSIQDSSLASEAAIWFGVSTATNGNLGSRMHLTQNMARLVAATLRMAVDSYIPILSFSDRYGCACIVNRCSDGVHIEVGVVSDLNRDRNEPMLLTKELVTAVMEPLINFIANGSIAIPYGNGGDPLATRAPRTLDLKIAPSMLDRADLGETGVSAQQIINALCRLTEGHTIGTLTGDIGYDDATGILEIRRAIEQHWRNADGSHAILR